MRLLLTAAALAAGLSAQDFLHYKFDSFCTAEVINYATGPGAYPDNGMLQDNTGAPFAPGTYGGALAAGNVAGSLYNRVATGWIPANQPMTGDITLAFYVREANSPGTALPYLLGTTSGFRMFTNGAAGTGLIMRNIVTSGGSPSAPDCQLPAASNFQALAQAGWLHVALVIDGTAGTATWYLDGAVAHVQSPIGTGQINSSGQLQVGYYGTTSESCYDMDEFLLANRAYSPTEVLNLATAAHAGDGDYDSDIASQCGPGNVTVSSTGGAPQIGNASYAIRVETTQTALWLLLPGTTRCSYGGVIPLPFDPGVALPELAGCQIVSDAITLLTGVNVPGVPTDLPLPIPNSPSFYGSPLFFQSVALDVVTFDASASNGFSVGIGL